jgi:hypothetical protein
MQFSERQNTSRWLIIFTSFLNPDTLEYLYFFQIFKNEEFKDES